ncbi:MAG TPA: hypothetical protein VFX25_00110 [Streptosporangiaceae bacterium]|nr:hypothetical protein [Streptosporangiaceae bacterium]
MGSHGAGPGAGSAPAGLRAKAARWTAGGAVLAALLGGGMLAAPAALAAPSIPVPCSTTALRNALSFAPSGSILVLASGCLYSINSALPNVTSDRTIAGSNDTFRATAPGFTMLHNDAKLQISRLTLTDGVNTGSGDAGALLNDAGAHLALANVTFRGNEGRTGGAILNKGELTVASSTFTGNEATDVATGGGAIDNAAGAATTVTSTTFTENEAVNGFGGAVESVGGGVTMQAPASTFTGNFARFEGGALDSFLGTLTVTGATFTGNETDGDGGAVSNVGAAATLSHDGFTGNEAGQDGGAVATFSTTSLVSDTFSRNRADRRGGGLFVGGGTATLDTTDIFANTAEGPGLAGGGIYRSGGTVIFGNNVIVRVNAPNNCTNVTCP